MFKPERSLQDKKHAAATGCSLWLAIVPVAQYVFRKFINSLSYNLATPPVYQQLSLLIQAQLHSAIGCGIHQAHSFHTIFLVHYVLPMVPLLPKV